MFSEHNTRLFNVRIEEALRLARIVRTMPKWLLTLALEYVPSCAYLSYTLPVNYFREYSRHTPQKDGICMCLRKAECWVFTRGSSTYGECDIVWDPRHGMTGAIK